MTKETIEKVKEILRHLPIERGEVIKVLEESMKKSHKEQYMESPAYKWKYLYNQERM